MNPLWPDNNDFAFTIIDDTDDATLDNIKPVYDYLYEKSLFITKTVWMYPTRNNIPGTSIQNKAYLDYIKELKEKGFEIQLHNVGSGNFSRTEILTGLELFSLWP